MNDALLQTTRKALKANNFEEESSDRFVSDRWIVEILPCHNRTVVFCFDTLTHRANAVELSTRDDSAAVMHCNTRTWIKRATDTKVEAVRVLLRDVTTSFSQQLKHET